jgi:fucose 4-O-acetylase-like acetyltransferase
MKKESLRSSIMDRSNYLDNISGLLIIHMIFTSHLVIFCKFQVVPTFFVAIQQILCFFMTWFFFKSGMFYKDKPLKNVLLSGLKRFLVPYIIFNIVGGLCDIFLACYRQQGNISIPNLLIMPFSVTYYNEATYSNLALWFLLSMFIVKILFSILREFKMPVSIICLVFFFLGFLMNHYRYELSSSSIFFMFFNKKIWLLIPYYFGNICYGLAVYSLGYLSKNIQYTIYIYILCMAIYIIHFFFPCIIDVRSNESTNYFLALIYDIAGVITFNNIFKNKIDMKIPLFSYVGRNSMVFYVTHFVFMSFVFGLFDNTSINKLYLYFIGVVLTSIFLFLSDKLFRCKNLKWMVGN